MMHKTSSSRKDTCNECMAPTPKYGEIPIANRVAAVTRSFVDLPQLMESSDDDASETASACSSG